MTQNEKVYRYLKTHKRGITPQIAYEKFGIMRLSGRIYDLRKQNIKIVANIIEVKNRYGETCRVSQYKLKENV